MAQVDFGFRVNSVGDRAVINAFSFSSSDMTISVEGLTPVVQSMANANLDDGVGAPTDSYDTVKLYHGKTVFTGLTENTKYTFTITQDGNVRTGAFRDDPGSSSFSMFFISCDRNSVTGNESPVGCYGYIKDYDLNGPLPVHSLHHYDDHGYVDQYQVQDQAGTGAYFPNIPPSVDFRPVAYYKALCYTAYEGMLALGPGTETMFHSVERQHCHSHLNNFLAVGDHEKTNNPEESSLITAINYTASKQAWVSTIGGAMKTIDPDPVGNGASTAWVAEIGPIEFISYDRLFTLPAEQRIWNKPAQAVEHSAWLTTTQINAILGEVNSSSPFKCISASAGVRAPLKQAERLFWMANGWPGQWLGDQQPLHTFTNDSPDGDGVDSEFRLLMTKKATSIGAIAESYGARLFSMHGDLHRPCDYMYYFPQDAANVELDLRVITPGSVNGSKMHNIHTYFKPGNARGGNEYTWQYPEAVYDPDTSTQIHRYTCVRLDVIQTPGEEPYIDVVHLEIKDPVNAPTVAVELRKTRITTGKQVGAFRKGWA